MTTRRQVLHALLKKKDDTLSGSQLAKELGVSRNAVWKVIKDLEASGYQVESKQAKGYQLEQLSSNIDPDLISYYANSWPELKVCYQAEVTSTNDLAKEMLSQNDLPPFMIIAKKQTQGRGRQGRGFYSELSQGLYFSLAIQPQSKDLQDIPTYTLLAAASLVDTLTPYLEDELKIKWVNDLFYQGKKVSGILSEMLTHLENYDVPSVVIGIGLNLAGDFNTADQSVQHVSGTLFGKQLPKDFNPNLFLAEFINQFYHYHHHFGDKSFIDSYRKHLLGLGQVVEYQISGQKYEGQILGINDQGHLLVEDASGQVHNLYGQDIHFSSQQFIDQI